MTRKQLEQLLPDYCFGRLSLEETEAVEQALLHYPDLQAEAELLRAVFSRLESMDYMRQLEHRSSILSCLVLKRWEEQQGRTHQRLWRPALTVLLPAMGLAVATLWWTSYRSVPPSPQPPLVTEAAEPFPYADGLVTFAYWSSGLPPLEQFTPAAVAITAQEAEELTTILSGITAEPPSEYGPAAP